MGFRRGVFRSSLAIVCASTLFLAACGDDDEDSTAKTSDASTSVAGTVPSEIQINGAWAREPIGQSETTAVYFTVSNLGGEEDTLLEADVDESVAQKAEIHEVVAVASNTMSPSEGGDADDADEGADKDGEKTGGHNVDMGDVMQMREVAAVNIPVGQSLVFEPGKYHVMLIGVNPELAVPDTFDLVLIFEKAGEVSVPVEVRAA